MTRFCRGLREVGGRALSPDERARLAALRRTLVRTAAIRGAGVAASIAAALAAADAASDAGAPEFAVLAFAAGALVLAAAALATRDALAERGRVARDLRDGAVALFAAGTRTLAVVPHSGRVLARDGAAADGRDRARVGAAAPPPPDPAVYAVQADAAGQARALGLVRRALSPEERDEIRAHAHRISRLPASLLLATVLGALGVAEWLLRPDAGDGTASGALWAILVVFTWWRALGARRLATRLREDEADGWVLRSTAGDLTGTELLPASRASWTAHGVPAAWRLLA